MKEIQNNPKSTLNSQELQTIQQNLERFRLLVENSHDLVAEVSMDGNFLYVSPNAKAVLGYESGDLLNSSVFERVHPDDLSHVQEQFALPEGSATCRYRHKDGSWRWFETTGRDFVAPDGQTRGVLIVRDITERKESETERQRLENHIRQMHKLEALGTLAGGIAHDFNNLLTAIIAYTELAVMDANRPQEVVKYLLQAGKASDRAKELVKQILTFSRKQKQERKPIRLQPLIEESLKMMRHTLPATMEIDAQIDPETSVVLADSTQIHQVMMNLCTNAAHAMHERPGRLTISLKNRLVDDVLVQTIPNLRPGNHVRITVSDSGQGMDGETLKHIFEPFFTTKEPGEGTGLGLPVVHGIVREHQGAITVQSQPGVGTTFEIYLPVMVECTATECDESTRPLPHGDGEHVLLVDDEPAVCASLRVLIMRLGYRVTAETHPAEALKTFSKNPDDFDLLISDLTMPRMTGVDLAHEVLEIRPKLPVLLASGSPGSLTLRQVRQFGVGNLLPKPASLSVLAEAIQKALANNLNN